MHAINSACSAGMREVALQAVCLCMQAITSATLAGLSDIVAQRIISRGALNWRRTAALAVSPPPHRLDRLLASSCSYHSLPFIASQEA